jgi:hypothetical protein
LLNHDKCRPRHHSPAGASAGALRPPIFPGNWDKRAGRGPRIKFGPGAEAEERHNAMKIKLDIDCTPDEVREFFGLPQLKPLQEELLKEVQERLRANIKAMDPEAMLKTWLPATLKGFEQLQEMFLSRMGGPGGKRK